MFHRVAVALFAAVLSVGSIACSSDSSEATDLDAEIAQEVRGGPSYTLRTAAVRGKYESRDSCVGGFDACDEIEVVREGDELLVKIGWEGSHVARAWQGRGGVLLFSTEDFNGDCDDPGCGNLTKISGVIYPTKKNNQWVPQIKATVVADFPFPDEEGAPNGEVKTVVRYQKTR